MSDVAVPLEAASWAVLAPVQPGGSVLWVGAARGEQFTCLQLIFGHVSEFDPRDAVNSDEGWKALAAPEASIDLALLPGVLGDVRQWAPGARPREAWESLLRAIHARLKPGGHVFVAAENRWAISRGSASRARQRSLVGSVRAYRLALIKAGFSAIRIWCAFPNWEDPKFLVECQQPVFDHFVRVLVAGRGGVKGRTARGALNALGVLKYTARWYWILARRGVAGE